MEQRFNPDLVLENHERVHLASIMSMPGYHVLHRVMRAEVDKFLVKLINADESDQTQIVQRFILAKAAAQYYAGLTSRLNEEQLSYEAAPRASDKPVDDTEGVLDLGGVAEAFDGVPNLLGDVEEL